VEEEIVEEMIIAQEEEITIEVITMIGDTREDIKETVEEIIVMTEKEEEIEEEINFDVCDL